MPEGYGFEGCNEFSKKNEDRRRLGFAFTRGGGNIRGLGFFLQRGSKRSSLKVRICLA